MLVGDAVGEVGADESLAGEPLVVGVVVVLLDTDEEVVGEEVVRAGEVVLLVSGGGEAVVVALLSASVVSVLLVSGGGEAVVVALLSASVVSVLPEVNEGSVGCDSRSDELVRESVSDGVRDEVGSRYEGASRSSRRSTSSRPPNGQRGAGRGAVRDLHRENRVSTKHSPGRTSDGARDDMPAAIKR
jgi:hypothetical protein